MRLVGLRVWIAASTAACWTSTPVTPAEPVPEPTPTVVLRPRPIKSPCEIAVDHVIDISHDELDKLAGSGFTDKLDEVRDVAVESCNETAWSPELVQCFTETFDNAGLSQCQNLMSSDQMSDLMKRITEVLTKPPAATP